MPSFTPTTPAPVFLAPHRDTPVFIDTPTGRKRVVRTWPSDAGLQVEVATDDGTAVYPIRQCDNLGGQS